MRLPPTFAQDAWMASLIEFDSSTGEHSAVLHQDPRV